VCRRRGGRHVTAKSGRGVVRRAGSLSTLSRDGGARLSYGPEEEVRWKTVLHRLSEGAIGECSR
jgi:hypothetical protein